MECLFPTLDCHFRRQKLVVVVVASRIIVPVPFLWSLDFGFETLDLDLGLEFGT